VQLLFRKEKVELGPLPDADLILDKINGWLGNSYYFSHFVVDGREVYEEPKEFLLEGLEYIQELVVIARTPNELVNDVLISAETYLGNAIPELSILANAFYNNPTSNTWSNFNDMLEGVQWINTILMSIDQMIEKPRNWGEYLKHNASLENELINLKEAMENSDFVLIADIIQYEILSVFESLLSEVSKTIDTEGNRHDSN
jgi:hypothetical protein